MAQRSHRDPDTLVSSKDRTEDGAHTVTTRRAALRTRPHADHPAKPMRLRTHPIEREPGDRPEEPSGAPVPSTPKGTLDIVVAAALIVVAAFAAALLPEGSLLRIILVVPALFFAPGYLLLQALPIPIFTQWSRTVHGLLAVGISPAVVGLLALSTALFNSFQAGPIIAVVTLASLAFAGAALYRRNLASRPRGTPLSA